MEPRSDERGRAAIDDEVGRLRKASMEPRSDERGRVGEVDDPQAVIFASMEPRSDERGRSPMMMVSSTHLVASMEPRSDERGRRDCNSSCNAIRRLQWSPVRVNAEGHQAEILPAFTLRLQWSRVRMNAEGPPQEQRRRRGQQASMEPRSDERGRATCGGGVVES